MWITHTAKEEYNGNMKKKTWLRAGVSVAILASAFVMIKDVFINPDEIVVLIEPNGEERFVKGQNNLISWSGGKNTVAIGLLKPEANTETDITSAGLIIGWINKNSDSGSHLPNSSFNWDGKTVCDLSFDLEPDTNCKAVASGNYKILVWSENSDGSMYISTTRGRNHKYPKNEYRGNWDVSDQPFRIVAP